MLTAFSEQQQEQNLQSKVRVRPHFNLALSLNHNEIPDFTGFQRAGEKIEGSQWIKTWGES